MAGSDDESRDFDEYRQIRDANEIYVGESGLRFHLRIDPMALIGPLERDSKSFDPAAIRHRYARQVADSLNPILKDRGLSVLPEPWGGGKTGGPIPDQQYAIQILGIVIGTMGSIVVLAEFADLIRRLMTKARELTQKEVGISNGDAVAFAARAILDRTGEKDLTFAFETPMSEYLADVEEGWSTFDGWLVGFRSPARLYLAHVDWFGGVTLAADDVNISWTPKR